MKKKIMVKSSKIPRVLSSTSDISSLLGLVPLFSASVRVTSRCQARCSFCSSQTNADATHNSEASTASIINWLLQLSSFGVQRLFLTGGEPTLRNDIGQIIHAANGLGFSVVMSTNGLVFDAARVAKRLGQSGLKHLQISLHGSSEKHDRLVGIGGAHETAVTAIKRFSDHIENVSVAMTITTDNLYDIESVIDKALTAGARWIAVHPVMVIGRAKPSHAPEIESVLEVIDQLSEEHKRHLAVMLPPAIVPAWARNTSFGLGYICTFPDMIAIDQEGNIAPCDAFLADKKWHMGNLRYNLLEEILSSGQATEWKNLRENPVGYLKGVCRQCEFLNLCCGGCRALSYMKYNHWGSPDIWCEEAFECGIFPEESLIKN